METLNSVTGTANAKDGCALFYRLYPQAGKPRVALIHSLALDGGIWDGVVTELHSNMEILVYDCRGHGRSERRPGPYSFELFADDLAAVMDQCGWPSAYIAGCSMGGGVAQALAAAYPKRAEGLALIDTTAWYGATAPQDWRARAQKAAKEGLASLLSFQLGRWFSDAYREAQTARMDAIAKVFLANTSACYEASCIMLGDSDLRPDLNLLRLPVAVIVGEEDYATPVAMSQSLHEAIAGSTLAVIPAGRHLTPIQCPKEIAAILKDLSLRPPVG